MRRNYGPKERRPVGCRQWAQVAAIVLSLAPLPALAEIDGHGPDAWRVTGVSKSDRLNARMGPGTGYRVIETFGPEDRGLIQVTCVPYLTAGIYEELSEAERRTLPARWCLMRSADLTKAGWVAQRYITPDEGEEARDSQPSTEQGGAAAPTLEKDARLREGEALVQALYAAQERAERGQAPDPLSAPEGARFFTLSLLDRLMRGAFEGAAHPLYGTPDFAGALTLIAGDPARNALEEAVVVMADFVTSGQPTKAAFTLSPDAAQPGRPLRISAIAHDGWSLPE